MTSSVITSVAVADSGWLFDHWMIVVPYENDSTIALDTVYSYTEFFGDDLDDEFWCDWPGIPDSTDEYLTGETRPPKDVVVLGGKTGTTDAAGHCLAIMSQNAFGQPFISIIMGAQNSGDLYEDMNILLSQIN